MTQKQHQQNWCIWDSLSHNYATPTLINIFSQYCSPLITFAGVSCFIMCQYTILCAYDVSNLIPFACLSDHRASELSCAIQNYCYCLGEWLQCHPSPVASQHSLAQLFPCSHLIYCLTVTGAPVSRLCYFIECVCMLHLWWHLSSFQAKGLRKVTTVQNK